ncbi:MAG TPA: hypothetical protein VNF93_00335, partial [Buchnera sp. (in: enterobacteria)]|nr:hypothetical protein [Buchnera sp. (in: enterobacteria)]
LFGSIRSNISLIAPIMWHPRNNNTLVCIDLTKNIFSLVNYLNTVCKQSVDYKTIFSLGLIFLYINRCPILVPVNCLTQKDLNRLNIDFKYCCDNLHILKQSALLKNRILFLLNFDNTVMSKDIDLKIYDAFFCNKDKYKINFLHQKLPLNDIRNRIAFYDNRINEIVFRCKARNFPYFLNKNEKIIWLKHCRTVLNKELIYNYVLFIRTLLKKYDNNKKKIFLLSELLIYIKELENYILL